MKSTLPLLGIGASLLTSLTLLPSSVLAKKDSPDITLNTFDSALQDVFYFDDSNVILGIDGSSGTVYRSGDAGATWDMVDGDGQAGKILEIWPHTWDNQRAYMLSAGEEHWMTKDQGKSWQAFITSPYDPFSAPLQFHGRDSKKVIWNGETCERLPCEGVTYYTDDDFATTNLLGSKTVACTWAVGTPMFAADMGGGIEDRIFCIKPGLYSTHRTDFRLVRSDNYFVDEGFEPALDNTRAVSGVISTAAVKKYLVAATMGRGTDELALYVTDDATVWHRAEFGQHRVEEDGYTILESTNYSMQVDVLGSYLNNPLGHLFTSNSNGTYFTKNIDYTNRNRWGRVDFEKVSNIQGIVLVNVVDNWQDVQKSVMATKKVVSKVSFDDGRTFEELKADGKTLHLHSVTDAVQGGRIFSSPAPGIVMGIGNTGKSLDDYEDGDLFVSDDAGRTWRKALDGAHMYEFGNSGAVLLAVDNEAETDEIRYSLNHGKDWSKADLEQKMRVRFLTTVPDSTTLRFLMMGTSGRGANTKWHVFKIDFDGLNERTCGKSDFERWTARVDDDGKPSCVMGHKQFFRRRKADADCFIDNDFKDPQPEFEACVCTEQDFECDWNFIRDPEDRTKCNPVAPLTAPHGQCKSEKDTFKGSSGWRLIPGNECTRKGGVEPDEEIERPCSDTTKQPISGRIEVERTDFDAAQFSEWYYLEHGESPEYIVMRDSEQEIYLSKDFGKQWEPILKNKPITTIIPNTYYHEAVYFLTGSQKVHYSIDRGEQFHEFQAPKSPSNARVPTLKFHQGYKDWLLWAGADGAVDQTNIYLTKDRGDNWQTLARAAKKCEFVHREEKDQLLFCAQYESEDTSKRLQLVSSDNFFDDKKVHFENILDFATMAEFIIVAAKSDDGSSLKVDASVDGVTFAPALFPPNFHVEHQQAYTVLDSSTHAVFLHVTVNPNFDQEYGTILKSNSNGTFYALILSAVNRDTLGYVDFEKMQGLEGVAMVNVVANVDDVKDGEKKKLKSMITHNDGAEWALIPPPKKDAAGNNYACVGTDGVSTDKCSLHIHSYTERNDKSATFSSPSAVGLMMAVGNVGEFLGRKDGGDTDTFITRDAGITWKSVMKGSYMWEYGDQGSIIVIVPEATATRTIFYTLDEGETWTEHEFSDVDMIIESVTTVPSDTSLHFMLWGKESGARGTISTVSLDFSQLPERQRLCKLDESDPSAGDYALWQPKHPLQQDNCLFGHVAQYHRKRVEAECYNGREITHLHEIVKDCECTRQDFECDYNYQRESDGTCHLVEGLEPQSHEKYCKENPDQKEYYKVTGYRKIPLSTCQGGRELDKVEAMPCPGYEKDFQEKHGISGAGLFFAIVIPIAAATAIGYWVWQRYQTYGIGGFGQIRLGESMGTSSSGGGQSPLIAVPVAIVAGAWALAKAVPLLATSLFRSAKGYVPVSGRTNGYASAGGPYRSRDAFSRRPDYSSAAYIEDDELLGDEDELEADEV